MRNDSYRERPKNNGPRINKQVRAPWVLVIYEDGSSEEMSGRDAYYKAQDMGLDLVEVSTNGRKVVCKIMDYGKWKYEQAKKQSEQKKNQAKVQLKQIKFRPKTDKHDLEFKVRNARKFLEAGNKVQLEVRFKGRENAHPDTGAALLREVFSQLRDIIKIERAPIYENRSMIAVISPK